MKRLYLVVFLSAASFSANAAKFFVEAGLHLGGDELASVSFVGGDSDDINAGELLSLSAGIITLQSEDFALRSSFGIKFDDITAENGDLSFTRFPVDVIAFSKGEKFDIGAGLTYHIGPEFEVSGSFIGGSSTVEFDDALGLVAEIDYHLGERGYLGLKATLIDYEVNTSFGSGKVDGNSIGFVIGTSFR